jgi:hypothetical protein
MEYVYYLPIENLIRTVDWITHHRYQSFLIEKAAERNLNITEVHPDIVYLGEL